MKIQALTIGMSVRHPQYGLGIVKTISEQTAEVRFSDTLRTVDPELSGLVPAEPGMTVSGLDQPLSQFVESIVERVLEQLGVEKIRHHNCGTGRTLAKRQNRDAPFRPDLADQGSAAGGFLS